MKTLIVLLIGLVLGVVATGVAIATQGAGMMLTERPSPVGLEETVERVKAAAVAEGWSVVGVMQLEKSIKKHGGGDVRPVHLVNLCSAQHAAKMMREDGARIVSVMMPCTIAVYEKSDDKTYVASMNAELLGKLFGGVVSEVMAGEVAEAQKRFVDAIDRPAVAPPAED